MTDTSADCSTRLRALAADARFARRSEDLKSLAEAVEDEKNDEWTGIDLFAAFPASSAVAVKERALAERAFGTLAAISVFLPVGWTWLSFHAASKAFQGVVTDKSEAGRTFLSLWTTGFDGSLTSAFWLIPTTKVSIVLIVLAIVCIVSHRWVAHSTANREEQRLQQAHSELTACLALAQRLVDQRRADDPERIETMVKRSVRLLLDANQTTQASADELRAAATELRTSLADLISSATEANVAATTSAKEATAANADLRLAIDQTLNDLSTAVRRHVRELHDGTKVALDEAGRQAIAAGAAISTEVAKVAKSQQDLAAGVTTLSTASSGIKTELSKMMSELGESLTSINGALSQHESAMQAQTTELSRTYDAAERMLRAIERLGPASSAA
jgi:hypothetical protein